MVGPTTSCSHAQIGHRMRHPCLTVGAEYLDWLYARLDMHSCRVFVYVLWYLCVRLLYTTYLTVLYRILGSYCCYVCILWLVNTENVVFKMYSTANISIITVTWTAEWGWKHCFTSVFATHTWVAINGSSAQFLMCGTNNQSFCSPVFNFQSWQPTICTMCHTHSLLAHIYNTLCANIRENTSWKSQGLLRCFSNLQMPSSVNEFTDEGIYRLLPVSLPLALPPLVYCT